ncbi:MAG TPA: hypothetical protein VNW29_07460, partial [Candidatus Sulfotelmatobacter sp.]|nr:hypothetical protein [Candidatus Sulfotelmatobacter sp.]
MADSNGPELQAGADGGELPAPKITFREIAVSEDFVISSEALRDNKKTILRTAGDATIILRQGDKNVSIFDLQGTKVDLPGNLSIADWEKVRGDNRLGSSNYKIVATRSDIPSGATDYIMVDKLPDNLRSAVTARLNASATNELELPLDTWQIDTADLSRVAVDVASDSITLYQPGTDNLIAFQRTNDAGTQLPVRNWARVDILTGLSQSVPQSVFERNNYTGQEGVQNIITTTNARTVIVSEEGFRVKRTGDNPSEPDLIIENLPNINNNICEDPSRANEGVIYYCSENPQAIFKLDTRAASPIPVGIPIPGSQEFHGIRNLCMDPSGNFITFSSNEGFFILDKETLEERGRIEHFVQGAIDDQGRIHGINRDGKLVIYEGNFSQFVANIEQRKAEIKMQQSAKQARGEIPTDRQSELEQVYAPYVSARDQNVSSLEAVLERVEDLDQIRAERMALERQLNILRNDGTIPAEAINELFQPALEAVIAEKEREIAQKLVTQDIRTLQGLIQGEWSTDTITQGDSIKGSINALLGILEGNAELLQQIGNIQEQFDTATTTFRREVNEHITTNTQAIISRAQEMIQAIGSKSALARWEDSSI